MYPELKLIVKNRLMVLGLITRERSTVQHSTVLHSSSLSVSPHLSTWELPGVVSVEVKEGDELDVEALALNLTAKVELDEFFLGGVKAEARHDHVMLMLVVIIGGGTTITAASSGSCLISVFLLVVVVGNGIGAWLLLLLGINNGIVGVKVHGCGNCHKTKARERTPTKKGK